MRKNFNMKKYGDWAIVTGGSSGIGKALVRQLCSEGINCIVAAKDDDLLQHTIAEFTKKYPVEVIGCACDLSSANFIEKISECASGKNIGILVNCASSGALGPFLDIPLERYIKCLKTAIDAYVVLTYKFLKGMQDSGKGAIIFVSSVNAYSPVAYSNVYTAAKAFELYFGEALWKELRNTDIDVLTICPSSTRTGFQEAANTKAPWFAIQPEDVVREGLGCLGKKSSVPIHWSGKIYYFVTKFLPRSLAISFSTWAINFFLRKK